MNAGIAGNLGPLPSLRDPDTGKEYAVRSLDGNAKVAFEHWVTGRAKEAVLGLRHDLPRGEWQALLREFRCEAGAGVYGFHGEVAQAALKTADGCAALMAILLSCPIEELIDLMTRHPEVVLAELDLAIARARPRGAVAAEAAGSSGRESPGGQQNGEEGAPF
jgi:hypothetical protein